MTQKRLLSLSTLLSVCIASSCTEGVNRVYLAPSVVTLQTGQFVGLELRINFEDPTFGGGILLAYDPTRLRLWGYSWSQTLGDDPEFRLACPNANDDRCLLFDSADAGVVGFQVFSPPGLSGDAAIVTIYLEALEEGMTGIALSTEANLTGPFFSAQTNQPQTVNFESGYITILDPE